MWGYPPWMYPPMYGSPQQHQEHQQDPVRLAKAWRKFLKEEKKEMKKEEPKPKTWSRLEVGLFLTVIGPFIGLVYAWAFLTLAEHVAAVIHP